MLFFLINLILILSLSCITAFADESSAVVYNAPDEIRGVIITPGEDFATEAGQAEDKVKGQIDNIINTVSNYGLNTIYLNLQHRNGTIYISEYYPVYTSFDALQYFSEKCDITRGGEIGPFKYTANGEVIYVYKNAARKSTAAQTG